MAKVLFFQASPRGNESKSIDIARTYIDALHQRSPSLQVDELDLWRESLPEYDGNRAAAKLNVVLGRDHQKALEKTAWDEIVEIAHRFRSADRYVFAVPMWNGGIPYRLKHYIDLIHQPGLTFSLDAQKGYVGLLKNKHATLVLTSGAFAQHFPSPEFGVDHQSTYLRVWLDQCGVKDIDEIRFQPTLMTTDPAGDLAKAKNAATALAEQHGRA